MAMFMRAVGKMINLMVMESITMRMVRVIVGNGKKIYSTDMEWKNGLIATLTRGTIVC